MLSDSHIARCPILGHIRFLKSRNISLSERPIAQADRRVKPGFVLGDAAVADLAVSEQVLDDVECMLAARPHLAFTCSIASRI